MRATVTIAALGCLAAAPAPVHDIAASDHQMRATNGMAVQVRVAQGYRLLRPTSRHASFDGHPYEVSLAAMAAPGKAVMLHAERVKDRSGHSNYDTLPESRWRGFHIRSQCASIAREDLVGEHDLKWLTDRGWDPTGNIALEQHLKSSRDHNREVVVSLLAKVEDCADTRAVESALAGVRRDVTVIAP
jgi:hypothetical protein